MILTKLLDNTRNTETRAGVVPVPATDRTGPVSLPYNTRKTPTLRSNRAFASLANLAARRVACSLLFITSALFAQPAADVHRDIVFANASGVDLKLDLYLPQDKATPRPLVVWVHGGGWRNGSKEQTPARFLLDRGYAVASINYRLSDVAKFPAQIDDCRAALEYLRTHAAEYKIRANRIGVWGASAGGHLVALLGVMDRVQAVVDFYGPTDLLKMSAFPSNIKHDAPQSPESLLIGGPIQENVEKVNAANPIRFIGRRTAPFLIVHGNKDMTVPLNQSELMHAALQKAGIESTFKVLDGAGHGGPQFNTPEVRDMVVEFLDRHLKGK